MKITGIRPEHDAALAAIIRHNLEANGLAIPGTAYFDSGLDALSGCYRATPGSAYYTAMNDNGRVIGGVGLAAFPGIENCAELQKLYLADCAKGNGYGYELIAYIKRQARGLGYRKMYLETHHNLKAAVHMYKKTGFEQIPSPAACVHSTMDIFFLAQL